MTEQPIISRIEYFTQLTDFARTAKKGDIVYVATMGFKPLYEPVNGLIQQLIGAARRGAQVTVLIDAFAFSHPDGTEVGPLWYSRSLTATLSRAFKHKAQCVNDLRAAGATVIITNKPRFRFANPVAGRSHIKFAITNRDVYIGGCNLTDPHQVDAMVVRRNDPEVAKILIDFTAKVAAAPRNTVRLALGGRDSVVTLCDGATLIIDAGVRRHSTIEQTALQAITEAKREVFITLQYPPYGALVATLDRARRRNVACTALFNMPQRFAPPANVLMAATCMVMRVRGRALLALNELRHSRRYMHAKILVADDALIIGSHNFVNAGVRFGTAEIAIMYNNVELASRARQLIARQLGAPLL